MRLERLFLQDIVDAGASLERFLAGVALEEFLYDDLLRSAVLQKLVVIGEASGRVSAELRMRAADIPWTDAIGFRNFVVHAYFALDWEIVWITATQRAPTFVRQVRELMRQGIPPPEGA